MQVIVLKETEPGERRVAIVPETVALFVNAGATVVAESGAGQEAGITDEAYREAGAGIEGDRSALLAAADVLLCVRPPAEASADAFIQRLRPGAVLIGMLQPYADRARLDACAGRGLTALAMELVPRITRAQRMDALSSQATVAGYKAVLLAASMSNRFFPMLMTAAGTVPPAKVLVLGAGVAGLQAIATARRLGAVVQGYDVRPAVKEQVESLGATWVGLEMAEAEGAGGYAREVSEEGKRRAQEHLHRLVGDANVVITTAQIPGRRAPILVTEDMMKGMKPGSVIVDLAAEGGGNCELTEPGRETTRHGVHVIGPVNLPATMPFHASQMYARNIAALLLNVIRDGEIIIDMADEVTKGATVAHGGQVLLPSQGG
jgi:H+-translocating NAD(P) transhydrogenase subunit alpha